MPTRTGAGAGPPRAGGCRRQLVHDREPVPRGPARQRRDAAAEVPRLPERLAARDAPPGMGASTGAARAGALAARPDLAERLDEAISQPGDAADRAVDPRLAPRARPRRPARAGDDLSALPLSARPGPPRPTGLLQHRRLHAILAAIRPPDQRAGAAGGARGRPDGLRLAAEGRGAARGGARGDGPDSPLAARLADVVALEPPLGAPRPAAGRPRPPAPSLARLRRDARGPDRLESLDPPERDVTPRLDRHRGPARPEADRRLVRRLLPLPGAAERPRSGLAAAGADPPVQPRLRRLPDPVPDRPPVQPRVLPDEDHGLHGDRAANRLDGLAGMPPVRPSVPRRRPRRPALRVGPHQHLPPRRRSAPRLAARVTPPAPIVPRAPGTRWRGAASILSFAAIFPRDYLGTRDEPPASTSAPWGPLSCRGPHLRRRHPTGSGVARGGTRGRPRPDRAAWRRPRD